MKIFILVACTIFILIACGKPKERLTVVEEPYTGDFVYSCTNLPSYTEDCPVSSSGKPYEETCSVEGRPDIQSEGFICGHGKQKYQIKLCSTKADVTRYEWGNKIVCKEIIEQKN